MASIREATAKAIAFAESALGPERTRGIRLEEVESTTESGKDLWLITLSMIAPIEPAAPGDMAITFFDNRKRDYKVFTVRKSDGEVMSMKIRELANA